MHGSRFSATAVSLAAWTAVVLSVTAFEQPQPAPGRGDTFVYFGTYTGDKSTSKGIYVSRLDTTSGALSLPDLAVETTSPSFLAIHPTRDFVYAVNEVGTFEGKASGSVSAFVIDRASGRLTLLNQQSSVGAGPAHLVTDRTGQNVLVANYGGGSVAVLPIDTDGRLKPASAFVQHTAPGGGQEKPKPPRAHSINVDSGNRFAYVADLGLDKVLIYRFTPADGSLVPSDPPSATVEPGAGPRHFAFHPQGRLAYVINERHCTITVFRVDPASGALKAVQTISTLPAGETVQPGYSTAEVQVHPSGRFLYGSNRGHNTVAVFAIEQNSGRLTPVEHEPTGGNTPRGFGIDPSGGYLLAANQRSDSVMVLRIDQQTGHLTPTGHTLTVGSPVAVKFVPPASR